MMAANEPQASNSVTLLVSLIYTFDYSSKKMNLRHQISIY